MAHSPIHVVADDREEGSGVVDALRGMDDVVLRIERLSLGDYFVDEWLRVERKTLLDLVVSIQDGRLFRQAGRLASASGRGLVLLEGTARDLLDSKMRREAIQGALITLTLVLDLPLLRSKTSLESARLIGYAARQMDRARTGAVPRASSGTRPSGKRKTQLFVLQGLPGIGPTRARRLLEWFGSVEEVTRASVDTLMEVRGIGSKTARSIRWAVEDVTVPYTPGLARRRNG